ncbi:unnamed protein product [Ostreobium quekettii]|uniref:Uncharacterized protein n=1 Tax=Ostreobium quekettii TaxID=121088 RepID=A0A8S1IXQ7_9CHLO|nr:unnamed protein product [Ostreobium quekettii]
MTKEQEAGSSRRRRAHERVLRYPDGVVRRIRYPRVEGAEEERGGMVAGHLGYQRELSWDVPGLWGSVPLRDAGESAKRKGLEEAKRSKLPESPAELLRYLRSEEYRAAERELQKRIRDSYEILEGCPWVAPRPLYVLAFRQPNREEPMTYTLRTRVWRDDTAAELAQMFRGSSADEFLSVGEVLDGVVAFQNQDDAQRFSDNLEAEGYTEVMIAIVDSHELFRNTREVKAVVVAMRNTGHLPFPSELAASLNSKRPLDDDWGSR